MSEAPTVDQLFRGAGLRSPSEPAPLAVAVSPPSVTDLFRDAGLTTGGARVTPEPELPEQAETDAWVTAVIKNSFAGTSYGLAARAAGVVDYEPQQVGMVGDVLSSLGSFAIDPLTYVGAGLGSMTLKALTASVGREAAEKIVTYAAKRGIGPWSTRSAMAGVKPAATFGLVETGRSPGRQMLETGEFDPTTYAADVARQAAIGAALGPASQSGKLAVPAEIGTFAVAQPLLEGRSPEMRDLVASAGAVLGIRTAHAIAGKALALRPEARDAIISDYEQRVEASQKDPVPNAEFFKRETGMEGTRKEREFAVQVAIQEKKDEVRGARGPEGPVPTEVREAQPIEEKAQAAQAQQAESAPVLGQVPPKTQEVSLAKTPPQEQMWTTLRNADTDRELAERGLPPAMSRIRMSNQAAFDEAMLELQRNPSATDELIASLGKEMRPPTKPQNMLLIREKLLAENDADKTLRVLIDAHKTGDAARIAELGRGYELAIAKYFQIAELAGRVGSESGLSLQSRQAILAIEAQQFSLPNLVRQRYAALGRELTVEELRSLRTDVDKAEVLEKGYQERLVGREAREGLKAFDAEVRHIKKEVKREARPQASAAEKPQVPREPLPNEEVRKLARKLAKHYVELGVTDADDLLARVHADLQASMPDLPRAQAMFAISGYGDFRPLDHSEIKARLRDLGGQLLQGSKLIDIEAGYAPWKSGPERRLMSDQERALVRQVNEAKKLANLVVQNPERQLRTSLEAKERRLENHIADLTKEIETGQRNVKERAPSPTSPRIEELTVQRDLLREEWEAVFGPRGMSDAERVARAVEAAKKSLERYQGMIQSGDIAPAEPTSRTPISPELAWLREQRDVLGGQVSILRRIDAWQQRLDAGDFVPKARKEKDHDPETERLRFELEQIKLKFRAETEKARRANRTAVQKLVEGVPETLNTARAVLTGFDLSAVLRQGGFLVFGHPIRSAKAMGEMFRSFASEAGASRAAHELSQRPNAKLYKRDKLALTGIHGTLYQQEEAYMSHWARKIPGVAHAERAYVTFLNRIRADAYDALAANLAAHGKMTPAEGRVIANFVNAATGRGDLGRFNAAAVPLATAFFSPRYVISRFQLLTLQPLYRGGLTTKAAIAKEYARTLAGIGVFYGVSQLAMETLLGPPQKKTWGIELDPRSSDFAKLRIGPTRIDPLFGLQQSTVLLTRLVTGETKTIKGKVRAIRGNRIPYGGDDSADVIGRFLRSKLSPVLGSAINMAAGENVVGQRMTPAAVTRDLVVPMSFRDIYDAMLAQGIPSATAIGLLGIFGMSVQTYDVPKIRKAA